MTLKNSDQARGGGVWRLKIAGIGVIGRCALKILGPFGVSYRLQGHQRDLEEMKRTQRTNQKTKNSKENRDIKGIRGNSKKKTHQSEIGDQKKNRNIKGILGK